jgi:hypothetical protein
LSYVRHSALLPGEANVPLFQSLNTCVTSIMINIGRPLWMHPKAI